MLIKVLYNSQHYSVLEYPIEVAYELLDKDQKVVGFLRGDMAKKFAHELKEAVEKDSLDPQHPEEHIENLFWNYAHFLQLPNLVH